jgi:Zn-dependent protease/CBS domain-containing protein
LHRKLHGAREGGDRIMFKHGIPIGRILGISIDLDYSWFPIVGLLAWMLAASYFPAEYPDWGAGEYWALGITTAVMLFGSVLIHELAHSVAARHYGIPVPRITLFLFGGVSQIASEPPSPGSEFWIAAVGPLTSLALAAFFWEIEPLCRPQPALALVSYLAWLNLILALFNLIPGFPLDGGRVFRALVWRATRNYDRATYAAAMAGRFFGFVFILWGVWQALTGNVGSGIWIAIIGWFLESAASSHLRQASFRTLLEGHRVLDAMQRNFLQVPGEVSLQELADRGLAPTGVQFAIVTSGAAAAGMVTVGAIRQIPRENWGSTTAAQIMVPFQRLATTQPDAVLWSALEKMGRDGVNQMPVLEGNGVVGILSREDVLHYLSGLRALSA